MRSILLRPNMFRECCCVVSLLVTLGLGIPLLPGCYSGAAITQSSREPLTALVIDFDDAKAAPGSGRTFTSAFTTALESVSSRNNKPYVILSSLAVHRTLDQLQLGLNDWQDPAKRMDIAKKAGADVLIVGAVTHWKKGNIAQSATVGYAAQCMSASDGRVLWSISQSASPFRWALEDRTPENCAKEVAIKGIKTIKNHL